MRSLLAAIAIASLGALGVQGPVLAQPNEPGSLRVGVSSADITPEGPVWMRGFSARKQQSDGVERPISAHCVVLDNGQTRAAVVALDLCALSYRQLQRLRAAGAAVGVPEQHVTVNCSHSHFGPHLGSIEPGDKNAEYDALFTARTRSLFEQAVADLQPAVLEYAVGCCTMGVNRRQNDGSEAVRFRPEPRKQIDMDVPILRVVRADGGIRAVIFGYACHPTTSTGALMYKIGTDFPGYARDWVEAAYPGATAVFLQGCGGDIKPRAVKPREGQAYSSFGDVLLDERGTKAAMGYELGRAVLAELAVPPQPVPAGRALDMQEALKTPVVLGGIVELIRLPSKDNPEELWETPWHVSTVRIGDVFIFGSQGEILSAIGMRIKRELSGVRVWTNGYTHWGGGYFPDAASYPEGGYEVNSTKFGPGAEDILVATALRQVEHLRTQPIQTEPVEVCYP